MSDARVRPEAEVIRHPAPAAPPVPTTGVGRRSGLVFLLVLALAAEIGMLVMLLQNHNRPAPAPPEPRAVSALERPRPSPAAEVEEAVESSPAPTNGTVKAVRTVRVAPHPMPEQLRAAQRIAEERRAELRRQSVPPPVVYTPQLAPSGRVIQLGSYGSMAEAEAAADVFRYRYRGLLQTLTQGIVPFRPSGASKIFYRVQFVTPSQAYAEVTCQRLRAASKTCLVIY